MRTVRCSGRLGWGGVCLGGCLPKGCTPPGPEADTPLDPVADTHTPTQRQTPPWARRQTPPDRQVQKHYLSATTVADGKNLLLTTDFGRFGGRDTWGACPSNFSFACSFWGKLVKIRLPPPPSLVLVPHLWNLGWATGYGGVLVQKGCYTLQVMLANDREPLGLSTKRSPCIYVAYKYWWGSHAWMISAKRSPCMVVGCK